MLEYFNTKGLDTYDNPMRPDVDGQLIHAVNVISFPNGAKMKRPGYYTALNNPDGARVNSLIDFHFQNESTFYLLRASGSILYYSQQGTGNWTQMGNGTIASNSHIGHAILNNTLILGDGIGSTRHTANGTALTNTTLAPVSQYFAQYHNRVYATDGTSSTTTFSSYGSADNWSISLPADSSSFVVPSDGACGPMFVGGDRLNFTKNYGRIYNWDDYSLVDTATRYGPRAPFALNNVDDQWFWINQVGMFQSDGINRKLISNPVQRLFYNYNHTDINASDFFRRSSSSNGVAHLWDYLCTIGTVTDTFTNRTIGNAILKYDMQKTEFLTWSFANNPTAWVSFIDNNLNTQLWFSDLTGQCYQMDPQYTSDAGVAINTDMVYLFTYAAQSQTFTPSSAQTISGSSFEKKWNWIRLFFNPGDEVNIQFAFSNSLTYQHLKWSSAINSNDRAGDFYQVSDGVVEIRFPTDPNNTPRSRYLFLRIYESSDNSQWAYFGCQIDAEIMLVN